MNKISAQLKMHYLNSRKSYEIFWSIMLAISILGFAIALYLRGKGYGGGLTANNIIATLIFCAISSSVSYYETFPYTINMGCTRKDFTFGFMAYNFVLSLSLSIIFNLLIIFEYLLFKIAGFNPILIGYSDNVVTALRFFSNIMMNTTFLMAIAALFALLSGINYLKGKMYLFAIGGLLIVLMFIPNIRAMAFEILKFIGYAFIGMSNPYTLSLYFLAVFILCYVLIYPIARVTQIKR